MVNYYIYAKDYSGSTERNKFYHSNGLKTFEQFIDDVEKIKKELSIAGEPPTESKIILLHWGSKCYEVDEETTIQAYIDLDSGRMGTAPESIINWIRENYDICGEGNRIKLLYIITDGLIHSGTEKCFELNEDIEYETVVFHAFNENVHSIDLSVAASFLKSKCIVYRNYELLDNVNISEEFDYDKITADNFAVEKEPLMSYVKLKFIRKFKHNALALQEIEKLKKLRSRLFDELSSRSDHSKVNLETKDKKVFLQEFIRTDWYKSLNDVSQDVKVNIEKIISKLINYIVSDAKSYAFDALKFNNKYQNSVEEEPIVDVNFTAEQEIEFPDIILDDEKGIPVVILTDFDLLQKMIFHRSEQSDQVLPASFSKFKTMMECPLFLMNDSDVSESIGYFYTLNVYKQLLEKTHKTEPRTRRPFHGGLVLTDTDAFDKYNDYVLSATYFNSKKINYNVGLFYFVLWKNCEGKSWMDKNVVEEFKKYTMRRISSTVCKIGLSSLPLDPPVKALLPTALWYCVELSSSLFKNDPQHFAHERLRMFYSVAHWMVEIIKYFDYDVDTESFTKRNELIRYVMILKKIPNMKEKVYYLLEKIFKKDTGFLISEIEKPLNLRILNYLKLNHKSLLRDDVVDEKVNLNDYVHLMYYANKLNGGLESVRICAETFRPFFTVEKNKSFYTELVKSTWKTVIKNNEHQINITHEPLDSLEFTKVLSLYNLFIRYVKDNEKYPTLPEYIEYISKKKKFYGNVVTIFPSNIHYGVDTVYLQYQKMIAEVSVSEFLRVTSSFVNRTERVKAEKVVEFNDDSEINEFIASEELKVKLIKV